MKFAATTATLLFASLSLATPAPAARPLAPETVKDFRHALFGRAAAAFPQLDTRKVKGGSGSKGGNSTTSSSAAVAVSPSNALMISALGVGAMEIVRLWI
jgi:hypothetical protein